MTKINSTVKETLSKYRIFIKKETVQTKEMLITFKDLLHTQLGGNINPTDEEIAEAINQLKDVGKMAALLPLVAMPGSVLTIPILIKLGQRYNIDILPKPK